MRYYNLLVANVTNCTYLHHRLDIQVFHSDRLCRNAIEMLDMLLDYTRKRQDNSDIINSSIHSLKTNAVLCQRMMLRVNSCSSTKTIVTLCPVVCK